MIDIDQIDWQKQEGGLVPAVIQDALDGSVLMLGYMNQESLAKTLATGLVTFWSRSRKQLWTKGESSGHVLRMMSIAVDCDADTLLVTVTPEGPTCHLGTDTCWGERRVEPHFFKELERTIDQRYREPRESSYTSQLFKEGRKRMAQKVGEEGVEVALAALEADPLPLLNEAADLIFHLMVLLRSRNLSLSDVSQVLASRHRPS